MVLPELKPIPPNLRQGHLIEGRDRETAGRSNDNSLPHNGYSQLAALRFIAGSAGSFKLAAQKGR